MTKLITITAPSCSGKTFLFEKLIESGFQKLVSSTTRAPRVGEVEGEDYFFICNRVIKAVLSVDGFIELNSFNGNYYGVSKKEFNNKIDSEKSTIAILTPEGVKKYEEVCESRGIEMLKIFIDTPEEIRLERLFHRCEKEIMTQLSQYTDLTNSDIIEPILVKHFKDFNSRRSIMLTEEVKWKDSFEYDIAVRGNDNVEKVVNLIERFV